MARIARLGSVSNDILDALKQSSNEATRRFREARHIFERCLAVSFFEEEPYGVAGIVGLLELSSQGMAHARQIVDKKSATLNLPGSREAQVAIPANHSTICKFNSVEDPRCELVLSTIAKEVERALQMMKIAVSSDQAQWEAEAGIDNGRRQECLLICQ